MIDDVAAKYGARVVRTPVGEANVVEAMKREKAAGRDVVLGGEGNGGVIWPRVTYVRDSLSAMALVLSLMARTGKTVSQLVADLPRYAIEKRKVDLARKEDAAPAVAKIAAAYKTQKIDLQDGVRVDWVNGPRGGRAWLHVRASNTEPIMRLIAEAPSEAEARAILDEAASVIAR
jgi:phosphomannomutase